MATCIFCNTSEAVNTSMSVKLEDGTKIDVQICDIHAEEATVKSAREAYLSRQAQIDTVLAQAKLLGLNLVVNPSGLTIVQGMVPQPIQQQAKPQTQSIEQEIDGEFVSTSILDRPSKSVGGSVAGHAVQSFNSYDMNAFDSKIGGARDGKAKIEIVEGRAGIPIGIPTKRIDKTGVTNISIVKTEDDAKLQQRFKTMATRTQQRADNSNCPDFAHGYQDTLRTCPICHGDCLVKNAGKEIMCPKCGGSGSINIG